MRVAVDALAARTGGGVTYLRSLLSACLEADQSLTFVIACQEPGLFEGLDHAGRVCVQCPFGGRSLLSRLAWQQRHLDGWATREGADVLFCPSEIAPRRPVLPVVLGLQNPNLYEQPVERTAIPQRVRFGALRAAVRLSSYSARVVVFVSEPFRRVVLESIKTFRAETCVVEPGLDPIFHPDGPVWGGSARYVLSVSDFYPYKNFARLVDAFAEIDARDLDLVIAGRFVDRHSLAEVRERITRHALDDRVQLLGAVPLDQMPALYRGATCFVFPSLLESFGFPPLEAMACGVPVACAETSVMPEICGDAPLYFDPWSVPSMAEAIQVLVANPHVWRERRLAGLERASTFDWSSAGKKLSRIFDSVTRHAESRQGTFR